MDRLTSKFGRSAEQRKESESSESGSKVSYLDYLRGSLDQTTDESALDMKIMDDLGINLALYSKDARAGFRQFLSGVQGFHNTPLEQLALRSPSYMGAMDGVPESERSTLNFIQGYLYDPRIRDAFVRASALFLDHPDAMGEIFTGRLYANYYGELIEKKIGDEAIELIAELADSQDAVRKELAVISTSSTGEVDGRVEEVVNRLRDEADQVSRDVFGKELRIALEYDPEGYEGFAGTIVKPLEKFVTSRRIFLSCCRLLQKRGELSLDDIQDSSVEVIAGEKISEEDSEIVHNILAAQYKDKYPEELLQELRAGLSNALKSSYSRFYIYRKNGEIVTYVRFDDLVASSEKSKHMGSFMVNPKFEGGALGQALLDVALQKETEGEAFIYAECDPSLAEKYQEFGFSVLDSYEDHGVPTLRIGRLPSSESSRKAA